MRDGAANPLAEELVKTLSLRGKVIAMAESCTAGMASDLIACISGASKVFWGGFVCYTPGAKEKMLGIPLTLIEKYGAVSRPVALAMAEGALEKSGADWALSITGLAGPGDDGSGLPVGTVWIGIAGRDEESPKLSWSEAKNYFFSGSRNDVRKAAAEAALNELLERILTVRRF